MSDIIDYLKSLADMDTSNMSLPEEVINIKDLSDVENSNWAVLNNNDYIAILRNGYGIPFKDCAKEYIGNFLKAVIENEEKVRNI